MDYFCHVCEKIMGLELKNVHLKSLTHIQYETCIRINESIQNPDFFDIDRISNDYITNHNKKYDLYLVECDLI